MNKRPDDLVLEPGEPDEPLNDAALWKALAQAPDRATLPDWRIRQAILDHAHDAISASEELLVASRERAPWWRLAWWRNKVGLAGATPWNAALASVMVAVLVTLLWQREPVPGARLDERPPAPASSPSPSPSPRADGGDMPAKEGAPTASGKVAPAPATSERTSAASDSNATPKRTLGREPAQLPASAATASNPAPMPAPPSAAAMAVAPTPNELAKAPLPSASTSAPPTPSVSTLAQASRAQEESLRFRAESSLAAAAAKPAASSAPPSFAAEDAAAERRRPPPAEAAPAPSRAEQEASRGAASAMRQPPAVAAAPAAPAAPALMPDFASLSRWTELRVANVNGDVRVVPRAQAGELGLLLSSAAIMAGGGPPLRSLPEWRVSLERRGQVLAVLEVARSDVRWTEGNLPPASGTPPAESIEALRAALRQAVRGGAAARAVPAAPPVQAPEASALQRLPYAPLAPPAIPEPVVPVVPPAQAPSPAVPPAQQ